MLSVFLLGFITLPSRVSQSWGEELIPTEWKRKKKNTLTESYPSSRCWHLHLNLLFLKGCRGRIVPLRVLCSHTGGGGECKTACDACAARGEEKKKYPSLWYFQFKKEANPSCPREKLSGVSPWINFKHLGSVFIMLMLFFHLLWGSENRDIGPGVY